jgi:phosphate starvation-inducible PhoH-like protein
MMMFLTRLGYDSKMVITGDTAQSDLKVPNGLKWAADRLVGRSEHISVVDFGGAATVRNPLIEDMLNYLELDPNAPTRRVTEGPGRLIKGPGSLLSS